MTAEELFRDHLALLERIVSTVCRRNAWDPDDIEDFSSHVKLKLIDDNYSVLRKFEGRASLPTFLTTVVQNCFRDYRIARWGKWRPSAAAQRLGPLAVRIETMVVRDGHSAEEAAQMLADRGEMVSVAEIERVLAEVPRRVQRRFDGSAALEKIGTRDGVEARVLENERGETHSRVIAALQQAFASLDSQDRLLLRLRFEESLTVARIATILQEEQKPLYRRLARVLRRIRSELADQDLEAAQVAELFGWQGLDEDFSTFDGSDAEN